MSERKYIDKTPLESWIKKMVSPNSSTFNNEQLENYHVDSFKNVISYAKERSIFYKKLLNGTNPENILSLESLDDIPFTTAEDIKTQGNGMICVSQQNIHRIVTLDTSGTTGAPKRIHFTKEDQELTIDFFHYGMSTFTKPKDKVLILLPGRTPGSIGDLLKIGLSRMNVEGIIYGIVDNTEKVMDIMLKQGITGIVGIPQQIFALTNSQKSEAIKKLGKLKSVLLSTDYVSPAISEKITKAWGCKVYEHYGMTEMGLGGGVFCEALNGYHLREADMIFEIVDPLAGKRIPDGNYGEIVFTTLTRKGMPLIRYRTGDISRFLIEPCPCGTVLKTMDRVQHRIASEVKLSNGQTVTMPMLEDIIFAIEGILDFDAEIYIESGIEILKVSISSLEEFEIIKQILLIAIEKSIIGSSIKSGTIKINIIMQGKMELDIKAIRKRNLIDRR